MREIPALLPQLSGLGGIWTHSLVAAATGAVGYNPVAAAAAVFAVVRQLLLIAQDHLEYRHDSWDAPSSGTGHCGGRSRCPRFARRASSARTAARRPPHHARHHLLDDGLRHLRHHYLLGI